MTATCARARFGEPEAPSSEGRNSPFARPRLSLVAGRTPESLPSLVDGCSPTCGTEAGLTLERLKSLSHHQENANYWSLETNTPFYGWGGRGTGTTALVLRLSNRPPARRRSNCGVVCRYLVLLRNQDQYGIWYTRSHDQRTHAIRNGSASPVRHEPRIVRHCTSGWNSWPKSRCHPNASVAAAGTSRNFLAGQSRHHGDPRRWRTEGVGATRSHLLHPVDPVHGKSGAGARKRTAEALRLSVKYDKTNASVGEAITCTVKAERVDFRGYGMMLAEIGLPPGAESTELHSKRDERLGWTSINSTCSRTA